MHACKGGARHGVCVAACGGMAPGDGWVRGGVPHGATTGTGILIPEMLEKRRYSSKFVHVSCIM